jgi:hypothetical protein
VIRVIRGSRGYSATQPERHLNGAFSVRSVAFAYAEHPERRNASMRTRSLVLVLIAAAAILAAAIALRGHGHELLTEWLPAIHGGRGH